MLQRSSDFPHRRLGRDRATMCRCLRRRRGSGRRRRTLAERVEADRARAWDRSIWELFAMFPSRRKSRPPSSSRSKKYGRINAIHNNAGIVGPSKPLHETTEAEWDELFNVNLKSVYLTTKYGFDGPPRISRLNSQHLEHGRRHRPGVARRLHRHQGRHEHAHQIDGPRLRPVSASA